MNLDTLDMIQNVLINQPTIKINSSLGLIDLHLQKEAYGSKMCMVT